MRRKIEMTKSVMVFLMVSEWRVVVMATLLCLWRKICVCLHMGRANKSRRTSLCARQGDEGGAGPVFCCNPSD